jgi:hypothetical protein
MDGDAFVLVSGNHVCLCMTALRDGAVIELFIRLFGGAKLSKDSQKFMLDKVADADKLKLIQSNVVKEIQLRATVSAATANYNRRQKEAHGIIATAARHIKFLTGKPNDVSKDGLQVIVTVKSDRRDKKHLAMGEKAIAEFAADLIEHQENDDHFTILLQNGQRISEDEIYVKMDTAIAAKGKSVDRDRAWIALSAFYKLLHETGIVET